MCAASIYIILRFFASLCGCYYVERGRKREERRESERGREKMRDREGGRALYYRAIIRILCTAGNL